MLEKIRDKVVAGKRISKDEALKLFKTDDIFFLGDLASYVAEKKNGKKVARVIMLKPPQRPRRK